MGGGWWVVAGWLVVGWLAVGCWVWIIGFDLWGHHFENKEAVGTTPRANRLCRAVNRT